jgi:hypothetical protein
MASIAANLVDNVLPRVPVRQWVLSLPRRLRSFLVHDERMARRIHSIFLRAIHTRLRRSCPDAHSSFGAIGWYHRFGAYINRHPHFHDVVTDGVFSVSHKEIVFHEADLTDRDISTIQHQVRTRILRCLYRSGCIDASTREDLLAWEHGGGFSVDASVHVPAWDRAGLERLLRYCARPSFSLTRLFRIDDSHIGYTPKKPTMDGRSYIVFTHFQLIDAITALIPPPRVNSHSYFGAFAPNSSMRPLLNPAGPSASLSSRLDQASKRMGNTPRSEWARTWAMLMARIFEILPLVCTRCGAEMKIISFITEPEQIHRILSHVGINPDPPPPAPARDPPQGRLDFDQAPEDYDQSQEAPDD